jgi:hypothetical protein
MVSSLDPKTKIARASSGGFHGFSSERDKLQLARPNLIAEAAAATYRG